MSDLEKRLERALRSGDKADAKAKPTRRDREMADDCAPMGTCSFCGTGPVPTVQSEVHADDIRICESCCDGAICAFLNRNSFLAPLKRRAKR
jgi:hypothetical protein